jgi:hypothetical protein
MFGDKDLIMVVDWLESVAKLDIGASENSLEGRKRWLPRT